MGVKDMGLSQRKIFETFYQKQERKKNVNLISPEKTQTLSEEDDLVKKMDQINFNPKRQKTKEELEVPEVPEEAPSQQSSMQISNSLPSSQLPVKPMMQSNQVIPSPMVQSSAGLIPLNTIQL